MSRIAFVTRIVAKPGKREELRALNESVCAQSRKEPGTLVYVMSQASETADEFWYFDVYADKAAFDTHCASDAYKHMLAKLGPLVAEVKATPLSPFAAVNFE
ncbi:MAG: antibiotic biosynthesis monooxygenase [Deltaproteobacteria bacterium]|nr:antibiotic biosynthesis monooxygenase [Deltaproteobacteria bacterium]